MPKCALYILLMVSMFFYHRYQLTHYLNHYLLSNVQNLQINIRKPGKYRNAFSKCIVSSAAVYLPQCKISRLFFQPSEDPTSLAIFNLLKASEKFRSIRAMPIPAEIVLENRQVNALLPWNCLVRGLLWSPALRNQQNKLSGTVME